MNSSNSSRVNGQGISPSASSASQPLAIARSNPPGRKNSAILWVASGLKDGGRRCDLPVESVSERIGERVSLLDRLMQLFQDSARGVVSRNSGHSVARMRAIAAEEKTFDRGGVARPAQDRAHGENLVEG